MRKDIAVVVPTKNSERTIEACLKSIRAQTRSSQIVVVDNFSSDATVEIARTWADIVLQGGPERSAQRNRGWHATDSVFILFADSDMVLSPDVLAVCADICCATGKAVIIPEISVGSGYWANCKALERSCYYDDRVVAAARFFPRSLLETIGGYDESLYAGEDWDLSIRAEEVGGPAVFAATSITHDEGALRPFTLFMKKYYYGTGLVSFLRKHPKIGRQKLNPLRTSLTHNLRKLLSKPKLACGVAILKIGEAFFGLFGIIVGFANNGRKI
jgi:glycosyltransferase involved in cell wall biosynthesis